MEYFNRVVVQERVKKLFANSLQNGRLAHAYLFYGDEGRGKEAFALHLARALNCTSEEERPCGECPNCKRITHFNHPDIKFIFPAPKNIKHEQVKQIIQVKANNPYAALPLTDSKNISIDAIRELKEEAKFGAFEGGYRVIIITGAEYFSREAANSFLKLLEEPPDKFLIILITPALHAMLDTIRSRCQPVYFPEFDDEQIEQIVRQYEEVKQDIRPLTRMAHYNLKRIFQMLHTDYSEQKKWVLEFIRAVAVENYFHVNELLESIQSRRGQQAHLELLNLLTGWFTDTLHLQLDENFDRLINIDFAEPLRKFSKSYPQIKVSEIIERIEKAHKAIEGNAHPVITWMNLAIDIHGLLGPIRELKEAI
ncbi:DNA polymerase III subunit [Caldithrix abyssi]|uniref:DNA polymerase III subunit delta' n=1 Tax=Caldithrix abyssi DSM 13497 TaxID=880073 RepID=H1XU75_CALAY|nr:DNA polymerase III subunit delta' [Caldithrix abyssi]APF17465.1 DNA polymerase-3 subunit delta' [Caldithrix abyssi DSM 13497]EHO41565.1 DNA-directed DNA polymerase [Caldithrix abyssi DSM 13497]